MILGITGGMGCGKSTAARMFESRGYRRIDSDALVRNRILPAPAVVAAIRVRYGRAVVGEDGKVDRSKLAERVFGDDRELTWLEELVHPMVFQAWRLFFGDPADPTAAAAKWAVETPLLFEKNLENWFDFTVCVACAPEQQIARLEQRGLNGALAGKRISKQHPLARKIELADFVLWNGGTAAFLQDQVDRLAEFLAA